MTRLCILACFCTALAHCAAEPPTKLPYQDPALSAQARAHDLVGRMTLEEKVAQMINNAPAIPRLGIPAYNWWSEGLHGVARAGHATVFPQAIGMAATWDAPLIFEVADVISSEARVKHAQAVAVGERGEDRGLTFWSPNINIFRDPRWGRGQETYGEDPYLTAQIGIAFVRGMQGSDPRYFKVIATPKHFAVHSGPEPLRHTFNVNVSPHDLEDTYLPAFRATVTAALAGSVMCAYNAVLGKPACSSDLLLRRELRDRWKFAGYVTSDCGAIGDFVSGHRAEPDLAAASAAAVKAGTDLDCGDEYLQLTKAVQRGLITEKQIDTSVTRLFVARFRLGMFDPPAQVPWSRLTPADNDSAPHRDLALRTAEESLVLLKRDAAVLPIPPSVRTIAVIGPNADQLVPLLGNYNGTPSRATNVLEGIQKEFGSRAKVSFAQGSLLVAGMPIPVPAYQLHPADAGSGNGLRAEYFSNPDFSGAPQMVRTDTHIDFDWRRSSPAPQIPTSGYSVRWTGTLLPTFSGVVQLGTRRNSCWDCTAADTVSVYADGKLLTSDRGGRKQAGTCLASLQLEKGRPIRLRIEYTNRSGNSTLELVWLPPDRALREEAVRRARQSDSVIMVLGISPQLEGEEMAVNLPGFRGGDRTSLDLPQTQRDLFQAVSAAHPHIPVVLMNGSPLAINSIDRDASAILEAWYPGEEGGVAVARALSGSFNPAGRLPVTFYRSVDQLPPFEDYSMANRTYRYFKGDPLYRFGYGLSYTDFAYSHLAIKRIGTAGANVSVQVRNTGRLAGDEVVQVYVTAPAIPGAPLQSLAGFRRIHLAPFEQQTVSMEVRPRSFSVVDFSGKRNIEAGTYRVWAGGGQPTERTAGISGSIRLTSSEADAWSALLR